MNSLLLCNEITNTYARRKQYKQCKLYINAVVGSGATWSNQKNPTKYFILKNL